MPNKVKISAGYSDKTSENYNSTQYSINLEMDATINGTTAEIEQASDKLFRLCRKIVAAQKGVSVDSYLNTDADHTIPVPQPQPQQPQTTPVDAANLCSPAQVKCIFAVAKSKGLQNGAINNLAKRFNKSKLDELSRSEASQIIKELKEGA